jgi:Mn-dependent DtxR family transcriptional regulator
MGETEAVKPGSPADQARQLYRQRRQRDEALGSDLFGEPAWDLLLDLYIARSQQRPVSVMSASVALGVPAEATWAWVSRLEEHGLVERPYQSQEGALTLVALSDAGFERMTRLLSSFDESE